MIIISWDVGIIHLAYCILESRIDAKTKKMVVNIIDWGEINLLEDERIKLECCGKLKAKKNQKPHTCGKNAMYYINIGSKSYGYCKTHLVQHNEIWSQKNTEMLFRETKEKTKHTCCYMKNNGTQCGKTTKYVYTCHDNIKSDADINSESKSTSASAAASSSDSDSDLDIIDGIVDSEKSGELVVSNISKKKYYCTAHYKSELNKKIKELSPQLIKNLIVKKYPIMKLQILLINKLDKLQEHFTKLGVEEVVIENQPSLKNPKMKTIANTLFVYFLMKGYIYKDNGMDIRNVNLMSPSNKLKIDESNTMQVLKKNKKQKYKMTKALGIQYTKRALKNDPVNLEYLETFKKQDDICDAYLQGRYYLEFKRNVCNKKKSSTNKKYAGSKTSKPTSSTKRHIGSKSESLAPTKNTKKTSEIKAKNKTNKTNKTTKKYAGSKTSKVTKKSTKMATRTSDTKKKSTIIVI